MAVLIRLHRQRTISRNIAQTNFEKLLVGNIMCFKLFYTLPFILSFLLANFRVSNAERSFVINYAKDSFYKDGKPFQYVSGSVHYFRMPNEYWRDRLRKVRAAGLNAISTYVEWSQHELIPGQYNFEGDLDVKKFIEIAHEEGLLVILRPGPYICAERDMGGLPYWLITKHPDVELRTMDSNYTKYAQRWIDVLMEKLSPLLYGRGGPIIMVQVENEYGSYYSCDFAYTVWLRDLFLKHVKNDAVLFTTDGAGPSFLKCGKIPGVYATVDFGPDHNVEKAFRAQRQYESKGPLVNSEYYPGWLTHWGEKSLARQKTESVVRTLREMLDRKANINFYMFYGGTNFGFTAGANTMASYQSDITSYDYDAPISEAGDLTDKYEAIKQTLTQYFGPPPNISVNTWEKGDYGEITLRRTATMFSPKIREKMGRLSLNYEKPMTFEYLDQNFGYLLYETKTEIRSKLSGFSTLFVPKVRDLANVYVDGKFVGNMSRELNTSTVKIHQKGTTLGIMVENLGRVNFGPFLKDEKGILSEVLLDLKKLAPWNMTSFEFKDIKPVEDCFLNNQDCDNGQGFTFYVQKFKLEENNEADLQGSKKNILDSYLDVRDLTKGLVFINGFNLGRYWSTRGPQYTIYVPGVYLKPYPEDNTMVVMDESLTSQSIKLKFVKTPIFS